MRLGTLREETRTSRGWCGSRGHASFGDWLDRRTGLAPREAAALMRTIEHVAGLKEIEDAWRSGGMTWYQADRVSRVASSETAEDWTRFVQEATAKRLDVELAAHAAMRVHLSDGGWRELTGGRPMRTQTINDLRLQWVKVFQDGAAHGAGQATAAQPDAPTQGSCNPPEKRPPNTPPATGPRRKPVPLTFSFDAPPEVAADCRLALRRINEATGGILDAAGCLIQMFTRFAATHVLPGIKKKTGRDGILRRDGFTCSMPHCRSTRNLEIHHVRYRSHGGRNQKWNLILLCHACHLLQHAGHVRLIREGIHTARTGLAPALIVYVGRRGIHASQAIYQEGILVSRYEAPDARPRRVAA